METLEVEVLDNILEVDVDVVCYECKSELYGRKLRKEGRGCQNLRRI